MLFSLAMKLLDPVYFKEQQVNLTILLYVTSIYYEKLSPKYKVCHLTLQENRRLVKTVC